MFIEIIGYLDDCKGNINKMRRVSEVKVKEGKVKRGVFMEKKVIEGRRFLQLKRDVAFMQNEVIHAPVNTKIYDLENEKSTFIKQTK